MPTDLTISLDDGDPNPTPDFLLNKVPIPWALWQNMKLLKDTYDMSKELTLDGYREETILSPCTIRELLRLHDAAPVPPIKLKRPLRDAKLSNLLPVQFVSGLRGLWAGSRNVFWNVYAASHILCDGYMFEYISAFLATICRDSDPPVSAEISRQLLLE